MRASPVALNEAGVTTGSSACAGLTFAPTLHSRDIRGEARTRFGEGVEFGFSAREAIGLSIGGTPVSQLADGRSGPTDGKIGISTLGWVAIGTGVALVAGVALAYDALMDASE